MHKSAKSLRWYDFFFILRIRLFVHSPLSDRFGRKIVMVIGLLLLAVATEVLPLGTSLLWLMIWRGLEGLAASSFAPVVVTYIIEKFAPQKRNSHWHCQLKFSCICHHWSTFEQLL